MKNDSKYANRYIIDRVEAIRKSKNRTKKDVIREEWSQNHDKSRRWLISYKANWLRKWDYFIVILALVNSIMIPLEIAVDLEYTKTSEYNFYIVLTDLIFFLDIVIGFNTTLN